MNELQVLIDFSRQHQAENTAVCLVTVVQVIDSAFRGVGARMAVAQDGSWIGGVSGGCIDSDLLKRARQCLVTGKANVVTYDTRDPDDHAIGLSLGCQGRIDVLFKRIDWADAWHDIAVLDAARQRREPVVLSQCIASRDRRPLGVLTRATDSAAMTSDVFARAVKKVEHDERSAQVVVDDDTWLLEWLPPSIQLVVVGDSHTMPPLVAMAATLGWSITLVARASKVSRETLAKVDLLVAPDKVADVVVDAHTAVIVMTHQQEQDAEHMSHFAASACFHLGLLGPRSKWQRLRQAASIAEPAELHAPVGLDLGAETPAEIALSICSEVLATLRSRSGQPLRERTVAIHDR